MIEPLVSIHLIGRHKDGSVWIQPILKDKDPTTIEAFEVFKHLCRKANAEPVGYIRCRPEGNKVQPYHSYFPEPATPEHEESMNNALCRVMIDGTGKLNPAKPYQVEAFLEDLKTAESLGIKLGSEQQ
jgi:hypothetical protein